LNGLTKDKENLMKKAVAVLLIAVFFVSCAGTLPQPVAIYQYGDEDKSCDALQGEIVDCKTNIEALYVKRKGKIQSNVVAVFAGLIIWPMFFAIDTKSDELLEIDALAERHKILVTIASKEPCEWCGDKAIMADLSIEHLSTKSIRSGLPDQKSSAHNSLEEK
jgi:hypothetical protein